MKKYQLTLYIMGHSLRSERAVKNLFQLCAEHVPDQYDITIIDVLEQPEFAEEAKILATPMLVKRAPSPVRRVVGDLSHAKQVLESLDI